MKLSEIMFTGDRLRETPDNWGTDNFLIVDEDAAISVIARTFDCPESEVETDGNWFDIARDNSGQYLAVNDDRTKYIRCEDIESVPPDGMVEFIGKWEYFEEEISSAARALGSIRTEKKAASSRENGKKGGRPGMYTVTLTDESGDTTSWPELTKRAAITLAKETAAFNPTCAVFIEWYRKSDGQHGYLNPSGDHEVTGHAW